MSCRELCLCHSITQSAQGMHCRVLCLCRTLTHTLAQGQGRVLGQIGSTLGAERGPIASRTGAGFGTLLRRAQRASCASVGRSCGVGAMASCASRAKGLLCVAWGGAWSALQWPHSSHLSCNPPKLSSLMHPLMHPLKPAPLMHPPKSSPLMHPPKPSSSASKAQRRGVGLQGGSRVGALLVRLQVEAGNGKGAGWAWRRRGAEWVKGRCESDESDEAPR